MNDHDLQTLIDKLLDASISNDEMQTLTELVRTDDQALASYIDAVALETLLEEQATPAPSNGSAPVQHAVPQLGRSRLRLASTALLVGLLASVLLVTLWPRPAKHARVVTASADLVAESWTADTLLPPHPVQLTTGTLNLHMASGVDVLLYAPCTFHVTGPNQLTLAHGKLSADVPPDATGFRVLTPNGDVIDHGTRIGVAVSTDHTELHVIDGRAEVILPSGGSSAMVELGHAVRVHPPHNAGYEPIPIEADAFFVAPVASAEPLRFGFEPDDPPWTATAMSSKEVDRGDRPATPLTRGTGRFDVVSGWVPLPTHPSEPGTFHRPDNFAPVAGEGRILPLPFHDRDEMPVLRYTSPSFMLIPGGGAISAHITGGRGQADSPPATLSELGVQSDTHGFMGLALRRIRDGAYLCSVRREPGNFYDWAQVRISEQELQAATQSDPPDELYALDLLDSYRDPHWSWIGLDEVRVPGRLAP